MKRLKVGDYVRDGEAVGIIVHIMRHADLVAAALPLILKLQAEAANPDASVTNLLRKGQDSGDQAELKGSTGLDRQRAKWLHGS
jgi:hypothetical protein